MKKTFLILRLLLKYHCAIFIALDRIPLRPSNQAMTMKRLKKLKNVPLLPTLPIEVGLKRVGFFETVDWCMPRSSPTPDRKPDVRPREEMFSFCRVFQCSSSCLITFSQKMVRNALSLSLYRKGRTSEYRSYTLIYSPPAEVLLSFKRSPNTCT